MTINSNHFDFKQCYIEYLNYKYDERYSSQAYCKICQGSAHGTTMLIL